MGTHTIYTYIERIFKKIHGRRAFFAPHLEVFVLQIGLISGVIFRWQRNRKRPLAINCTKQINVIFRTEERSFSFFFVFFELLFTVKDTCVLEIWVKQQFHLSRVFVVPAWKASYQKKHKISCFNFFVTLNVIVK